MKQGAEHTVLDIRQLTSTTYVVQFERKDIIFVPGQNIFVGIPGDENRPYSIYSGINDDFVEILIKEVAGGNISVKIKQLSIGLTVTVGKPVGHFVLEADINRDFVFIATGTGVAPFHSFVKSFPNLKYELIHGVRLFEDAYDTNVYNRAKYNLCTSGDNHGDFIGRVTDYLKQTELNPEKYYYLCGSYDMIDEVYDILADNNIPKTHIKTEGYF